MEATRQRIAEHPPGFTPTPRHPSRAMAGLLLAAHRHEDFEVLAASPGKVKVPSRSKPGNFWTVDADSPHHACPCPIYRFGDARTGIRLLCHHVTAAELVLLFRKAAPGVSFRIERRHDSRLGLVTFDVIERSCDYPAGHCWSAALSLEAALLDVVDAMQERIAQAGSG